MKLLTLVYVFCLFYVFIPGNLFKLPFKTSKMNHVLLHALLFSGLLSMTYPHIENIRLYEPMTTDDDNNQPPAQAPMPPINSMSSSTPPPPPM